jgi:hypothetical protein
MGLCFRDNNTGEKMKKKWRIRRSKLDTLNLGAQCYELYKKRPTTWGSVGKRLGISGAYAHKLACKYAQSGSLSWPIGESV